MKIFKLVILVAALAALSACSSKFKTYNGPEVTQVQVHKSARKMYLIHHDRVLRAYDIGLGFNPDGHKMQQGDGRTPEGAYLIDRRNPNSKFHLSLGINYPNEIDVARASALGVSPGGDIFIHGRPKPYRRGGRDWTAGCIGVTDREIEEIYAMVRDGTPVYIYP